MRAAALVLLIALVGLVGLVGARLAEAITWGAPDGAGHPNVGAMVVVLPGSEGEARLAICSGTLVHPKAFLTAAHCPMVGQLLFGIGPRDVLVTFETSLDDDGDGLVDPGKTLLQVADWAVHPQFKAQTFGGGAADTHDIALLILEEAAPGVVPAALPPQGFLDQLAAAGQLRRGNPATSFVAVGYGVQELKPPRTHEWDGLRRVSRTQFQSLLEPWLLLNQVHSSGRADAARKSEGSCFGDSGGPGFWVRRDGTEVLVAVESWGDSPCVATAFKYRIDSPGSLSFIHSVIDPLD